MSTIGFDKPDGSPCNPFKVMERSRIYDEPISNIEKLIDNGRYEIAFSVLAS